MEDTELLNTETEENPAVTAPKDEGAAPPPELFETPLYKRSRKSYIIQCMLEYFISLTVTDAYLAKLLNHMGFEDYLIGIISSFISVAYLFQIFSLFITRTRVCRKTIIVIIDIISQLLFAAVFLVPFFPFGTTSNKMIVMFSLLAAYALWYLMFSTCFQWANSNVDPRKRASFSATKEIISLITGIFYTLAIGWMFDYFEGRGEIKTAFLLASVVMFVCCVADFICLLLIRKDTPEERGQVKSWSSIFKETLGKRNFRTIVYLTALWEFGRYFSVGFLGTFKTQDLLLSVLYVQIINIGGAFFRMITSKPFGRYSDRTSFARGMKLALIFAAAGFLCLAFTTKTTWYLIIGQTVLYSICLAGFNANSFNITYSYVDAHYVTEAMSIKNSIGGLCGFSASLIASRILDYVQKSGNVFLGIPMYGQQFLGLVSAVLMIAAFLFTHFVITKQKVLVQ